MIRREWALRRAKNEMTARLAEHYQKGKSLKELQEEFENRFFESKTYNYLKEEKEQKSWEKNYPIHKELTDEIIIKGYRDILEKALQSFANLVEKGGYTEKEGIALLTDKQLSDWPKTVDRLLKAENN